MRWDNKFEVVQEIEKRKPPGSSTDNGNSGSMEGDNVALVWSKSNDGTDGRADWSKATVGAVEYPLAADLVHDYPDYADLACLGNVKIPTLVLNSGYSNLKSYIDLRLRDARETRADQLKDEYAVGVGVGLLLLEEDELKRRKHGEEPLSDGALTVARDAIARSVLTMLPRFDTLSPSE